jgi:hypothetical protein
VAVIKCANGQNGSKQKGVKKRGVQPWGCKIAAISTKLLFVCSELVTESKNTTWRRLRLLAFRSTL